MERKKIKAILFDFDGVLCESVEAKTIAFRKLFEKDYPEYVEKIVDLHVLNGGMSRYKKFEIIYKEFLGIELTDEKSKELGRQFSEICYDEVIKAPLVKGAIKFLKEHEGFLDYHIVSGTPHEEIVSVVKDKKIDQYFKSVHGAPQLKKELISLVLEENSLNKEEVVFVGDAVNDIDGAKQANVFFVGRVHEHCSHDFIELVGKNSIKDIDGLEEFLIKAGLLISI